MRNQSRKIEIFLKDGFQVGTIKAGDVDTVLRAIEGHSAPSPIIFKQGDDVLKGVYSEITSGLIVPLDQVRTQYFHKEQILVYAKGVNLF
ncbi:hypothetical protein [Pseudomonas salomonii]|uniref:Uncharacterized protein n=1 Tax=Pseudomonas salomonii TaxID=191391 RepID=A0A1H3UJR2_9PSED|nr:hypothetical protein [Pseudomonas salomonii]SDZ62670.1 hypothetical protein SAMN05216247_114159 [Pseudomonas salomonii]